MLEQLFPITDAWSYATFFLYLAVTFSVTGLCKMAARSGTKPCADKKQSLVLKKETLYYFLAYMILVLLATVRTAEVGSDTAVYVGYFDSAKALDFELGELFTFHQMEPGFQLYLLLIKSITDNYNIFFFITYGMIAAAYIAYIKYFFDDKSDYLFLQIFIFFYVSNMSGMRSAMGMIFFLPSFLMLSQKKYIKSIFLTILASCFHYTMIFNLAIIFMVWILSSSVFRNRRWVLPTAVFSAVVVSYAGLGVLNGVIASTKYGYYTTSIKDLSLLGSSFYILFGVLIYFNHSKLIRYIEKNKKYESVYLTSISFLITYPAIYFIAAYRIPNYYAMPRLTIWSILERRMERKCTSESRKVFRIGMQLVVVLYLLFRFTRSAGDGAFAYQFMGTK